MKYFLYKMPHTLCLAVLLIFSNFVLSQSKKYPSLLWKISGNGLKKESYLYGTMHVSKKVVYHLSDQFFDAINSVDVVGLETNPGEWMKNMDRYGMFDEQKISKSPYSSRVQNFYEDAFKINFLTNKSYGQMLSFDPDIINALLFRLTQSKENYEENTYIDLFIYQAAIKWNKTIVSLEDFKSSLVKARLAEVPDAEAESEASLVKKYQSYYEVFERMEDAYRKGSLDEMDSLSKVSGRTKNFEKYLLEDRNDIFVKNIDSIMQSHSVFAGVGAAHLSGPKGLIEQLRKKGYKVEPVMPKTSEKGNKLKDEIENLVKPVTFRKQFSSDSLISYSAPEKLVLIQSDANSSFELYPDMANGTYYSIGRCKTYAPLIGYDVNKMKQKVDSLLYENIPGKIISKSDISVGGWPGLDLVNKTKKGDLQRYQVFFTDLEMIVFKLAGKENYVNTEDAKKFFNSIEFRPANPSFKNFSPPAAGFTVKLPGNNFYGHTYGSQETGVAETLFGFDKSSQTVYGVIHAYYNDNAYIEQDTFELNVLANNVLKNFSFKEAETRILKKHQGFPAIEFTAKNSSQVLTARIITKGVHYYLVYAVGLQKKPAPADYFNSFDLNDFKCVNAVKVVEDKEYSFSVKDEQTESASEDLEREVQAEIALLQNKPEEKKKRSFESDYKNKYYFSPSSCEHVYIEMNKLNDYSQIDKKEAVEFLKKPFKVSSFTIASEKVEEKNGLYHCQFVISDTASVKAIRIDYFIKNGVIYTLSSAYDSNTGLKGWAKDFFETFTPKDTVIGKNVFSSKFKNLAADLCSADTAVRSGANTALLTVNLEKNVADELADFISSDDFQKVSSDSRAFMLVTGGTMESERIIAPYKKLYKQYGDSSFLQMCIIKGLAYLKTKNSYAAILELLGNEPPLVSDDGIVNDVFAVLYDSLELCRPFYPSLFNLLSFPEYKQPVYKLLSELVSKKIITSSVYDDSKPGILTEANYELRRFNSSLNKAPDKDNSVNPYSAEYGEYIKYFWRLSKEQPDLFESATRPSLVDYAIILAPFYKSDENAKVFLQKVLRAKSNEVLLPVCLALLENGITAGDSTFATLVKAPETRLKLYTELSRLKKTELIDKYNLTQDQLCESKILDYLNFDLNPMFKNPQAEKRTLQFLKTIKVQNNYYKGDLYVFKMNDSKNLGDFRVCAFVKENNRQKLTADVLAFDNYLLYDKDKGEDFFYNDLRAKFYYLYHRRYNLGNNQ